MALLSSLVLAASVSAWLGEKSVEIQIDIPARTESVWQVIADTNSYPSWNPVFTVKNGELKEGNKITYVVKESDEKSAEISSRVVKIKRDKLLNQQGGVWGVITFDHSYHLEPIESGTRLIIHEKYTGLWVNFWDKSEIENQYKKLAIAIKNRVNELN